MKRLILLAICLICSQFAMATCPGPNNFTGEYYYDDGMFGARLAWDRAVYGAPLDRFEIYRSIDGENFELVQRIVNTPSISHYECIDIVDKAENYYYRIIAFYQDDCKSEPIEIQVLVTSVGENLSDSVAFYPNPSSGKVNIKAETMQQITVINAIGQVVLTQNVDNNDVTIDMSACDNGMYLVNIITEKGKIVKILNILR